jgi:peptide/nickel transport system substrate-binding protein
LAVRVLTGALAGTLAVALASCASSQRGSGGDTNQPGAGKVGGTMTFGAEGAPKLFDPFYASDGATFRVARQMFEGLVAFKPGTADVIPALATGWKPATDGKTWTFTLRSGVKFTDGTTFDAQAVCDNFTRWYGQTGIAQSDAVSQYWVDNFGGFSDGKAPSLYKSCAVQDPSNAVITLTSATSKFPALLGLPSFSMQSPAALKQYDANNVTQQGDSFAFPAYATAHPTGTGPFTFGKYDKANNTVELDRNENYWGDKAKLDKLIFKIIPDETARKQELQAGNIDGYDLPNPADWAVLKNAGFNVEIRPAFNILYLGITQKNNPKLADLRVRQAIAHALDRESLVKQQLPEGATVAKEFIPPTVEGYNTGVADISYDPTLAKQLLAQAGATDLTLNFYWPSEVTRPYMPSPKDIFGKLSQDLAGVGIKVNAVTKPWNGGYLDDVDQAKADVFLLGWTGDYNTPDNFLSAFFGATDNRLWTQASPWGQSLADEIKTDDAMADETARTAAYEALNKKIVEDYLPAVPISHSPPAIVVSSKIQGLVPSPLTDEKFQSVSKN